MKVLLKIGSLFVAIIGTGGGAIAQPSGGSQLAEESNSCALCHGTPDLWEEDQKRLLISTESLAEDVHYRNGVRCHDCHGGDPGSFNVPEAHSATVDEEQSNVAPFRSPLSEVRKSCAGCHEKEALGLADGVHAEVRESGAKGRAVPHACDECHGEIKHNLLAVSDPRSPVFVDNQVHLCGNCHEGELATYIESVHGHGLKHSGLAVTAVCADCHGAHAIYPASDQRSTLYATNVAGTCAKCHRFIEERLLKSVHGSGNGPGGVTEQPASGGEVKRKPSCTDCHFGHDLQDPTSARFRSKLPHRCGNCHADLSDRYGMSLHGELTDLGYGPAAKCSDCHGDHDILPISDPASRLSVLNRLDTCKQCHPSATRNFLNFDPHADHHDPDRNFVLHMVYLVVMTFLISTFSFFGLHSLLWFLRGMVHVIRHGRPKRLVAGNTAYMRFTSFHRMSHAIMAVSFLGLAMTGLPLKYSHSEWAQTLAYALGGFESTGLWHRIFGLVNIGCLVVYVFLILSRLLAHPKRGRFRMRLIFGPDSPVPNFRDLKDFCMMVRWFVGLGPKPTFDRWAYWEKVDIWGACADIVVIGFTGLVLWFPNLFCTFLPGETLNIAKVIHSTQALLATGFIFAIHFFNTHFRPERFPMDLSVLTGLVTEEELREERPKYLERMRREGRLEQLKTTVPSRRVLLLTALGGYLGLAIGLALLVGILLAVFGG